MFRRIWKYFSFTTVLVISLVLVVLLILYLLISSSGFITKAVLPMASAFSGVEIVAENFTISPFKSQVNIRNFRIGAVDKPFITIGNANGRYGFWHLTGGKFKLHNAFIDNIHVFFDGKTEKTPDQPDTEKKHKQKSKSGLDPARFDLSNITVHNANIRYRYKDFTVSLNNLELNLDNWRRGRDSAITVRGETMLHKGEEIEVKGGNFLVESNLRLNRFSLPEWGRINLTLNTISGHVSGIPVKNQNLETRIEVGGSDNSAIQLHDLTFRQWTDDQLRSTITAKGILYPLTLEGRLRLNIKPLSSEIIQLAAICGLKVDPGTTSLNYSGELELSRKAITTSGALEMTRSGEMTVAGVKLALPDWTFNHNHYLVLDREKRHFILREFSLSCRDAERELIRFAFAGDPLYIDLAAPDNRKLTGGNVTWQLLIDRFDMSTLNPMMKTWDIIFGNGLNEAVINGKLSPQRGGFNLECQVKAPKFFIRIDDYDLEFKPNDCIASVKGNINPVNRMFTIDKATVREVSGRGSEGYAEVTGLWDLNNFLLTAHVEVSEIDNQSISPQPMIPDDVREIIDFVMGKFAPAQYLFSADVALDLWNGELKVPNSRLRIRQENNEQIIDIADFHINWDMPEVYMGPMSAVVHLKNFPARQLNSWLPFDLQLCADGAISGKILYLMNGVATFMEADVDVALHDFALNLGGNIYAPLVFSPRFKISLTDYDRVKLDHLNFKLERHNKNMAELSILPTAGSISDPANNPELKAYMQINDCPLAELNPLIKNPTRHFENGLLNADINGVFHRFGRKMKLGGVTGVRNLTLLHPRLPGKDLSLNTEFKLAMHEYREVDIQSFNLNAANKGKPAAAVDISGHYRFQDGDGNFVSDIRHLNQYFLTMFYPEVKLYGNTRGKVQAELKDNYRQIKLNGDLELSEFGSAGMKENITGRLKLNLHRDNYVWKSQGNNLKLDELADISWENDGLLMSLTSNHLDLLKLRKLLAVSADPKESPESIEKKPSAEPQFNFKPRQLAIDLQGVTYSQHNNLSLKGEIQTKGAELKADSLTLTVNNTPIHLSGNALSEPDGMVYNLRASTRKLDIGPLTTSALPGSLKKISGITDEFDLRIKGKGVRRPALWDNMEGYILSEYSNISIPDQLQNTMLGRIFFLPLRVVNEIRNQIGGVKNKRLGNAFSRIVGRPEAMDFKHGVINVAIDKGRIKLDEVFFEGDFVREMRFTGGFGLGSDPSLLINSNINVEEVILPVTLRGTITHPEPDYAMAIIRFAAINTGSLIQSFFGIFTSGTLQDLFETLSESLNQK